MLFLIGSPSSGFYTLSLHDALPICHRSCAAAGSLRRRPASPPLLQPISRVSAVNHVCALSLATRPVPGGAGGVRRSEEHTSELQSQSNLVCRLLLEKKNSHPVPMPR